MNPPGEYKTAGLLGLISGMLNLVTAAVWVLTLIWLCVGIVWFIPMLLAGAQIALAVPVMNEKPAANAKLGAIFGIVAGILNLNPFPVVLSIIAILQLNKPEVSVWLEQNRQ